MNETVLYGNRHIVEPFLAAAREGRLASAYLFEGPKGSGKKTLASFLSRIAVCSDLGAEGACFSCRDCENVTLGSHPDVVILAPEKEGKAIDVKAVRAANEEAMTSPIHAARRVFVILDAAAMNTHAQNALLKNLEEPRGKIVYLLFCEEAGGVLATIRSRCVIYRMELFGTQTLLEQLKERYPKRGEEELLLAARLSGGALGQAEELLSDKRMAECRKTVSRYLELVAQNAPFAAFSALVPADTKKEFLPLFYRVLLSGVRDLLCAEQSADRLFFAPDAALGQVSKKKLSLLSEQLFSLLEPSMANANVAASVFALHSVAARRV